LQPVKNNAAFADTGQFSIRKLYMQNKNRLILLIMCNYLL
jgi:hypothetical protein